MIEITLKGRGANTMSTALLEDVEAKLDAAGEEPILVTGEGVAFSAGLDLVELSTSDGEGVATLLAVMGRVCNKLFVHPAPTLALVNGHAVAGGCLLAQCCDLRIATNHPKARIGMTGLALGLTYPPFVFEIFRKRVPAHHLETIMLGAKRYAPPDALRLGLIDEVFEPHEVRARALESFEERLALPRQAYANNKLLFRSTEKLRSDFFEREVLPSWTQALTKPPPAG